MAKMGNTTYKVEGRMRNALELIAMYERERGHECRKYHCRYITLNGEYARTGIAVRIFLVKYGHMVGVRQQSKIAKRKFFKLSHNLNPFLIFK